VFESFSKKFNKKQKLVLWIGISLYLPIFVYSLPVYDLGSKYFSDENVLNKSIEVADLNGWRSLTYSSDVENLPDAEKLIEGRDRAMSLLQYMEKETEASEKKFKKRLKWTIVMNLVYVSILCAVLSFFKETTK